MRATAGQIMTQLPEQTGRPVRAPGTSGARQCRGPGGAVDRTRRWDRRGLCGLCACTPFDGGEPAASRSRRAGGSLQARAAKGRVVTNAGGTKLDDCSRPKFVIGRLLSNSRSQTFVVLLHRPECAHPRRSGHGPDSGRSSAATVNARLRLTWVEFRRTRKSSYDCRGPHATTINQLDRQKRALSQIYRGHS